MQPPAASSPPCPAVEGRQLCRRFGHVLALDRVDLTVRRSEFFSLLGPSGCGKTTLLRIIAGLDHPDEGELRLNGVDALPVPAHRRAVNTVFQSYALFPHLNVRENVAFGLRMKRLPPPVIDPRVRQALELARIGDLASRLPAQLSGGQKQRVALARAVVNEPDVLLLDEPLGALDLQLRRELQGELRALQRRLGITFIHVTHDQEEALAMSDRVAVMNAGRIEQVGAPADIYNRPRTRFTARFLGACNLIEGAWGEIPPGSSPVVRTTLGEFRLPSTASPTARPGQPVTLAFRPERMALRPAGSNGEPNAFATVVREVTFTGAETHYMLEAAGVSLRATHPNTAASTRPWSLGEAVTAVLPPEALVVLED